MTAPDELNERQLALLDQVQAGEVTEHEPDTEAQLLTLARLGHLAVDHDADGYHFAPGDESTAPETDAEPEQQSGEQADTGTTGGEQAAPPEPQDG